MRKEAFRVLGGRFADRGRNPPSRLRSSAAKRGSLPLLVMSASVVFLIVLAGGAGALTRTGMASSTTTASYAIPQPLSSSNGYSTAPQAGCDYTIAQQGTTLVAAGSSNTETRTSANPDVGAFLNSLLAPHKTFCIAAGVYTLDSEIQVSHLDGVTLSLAPGAVMKATSASRLLLIFASPGTTVRGGEWVGPARGQGAGIRILDGSNNTIIEGADISKAGWDGIFVYEYIRPNINVSLLDNRVHDNGRYGVQVFSRVQFGITGTLISGNVAVDNGVGGFYTNGVAGVTIIQNVARNSVGNGPGAIGIGVTNAHDDVVTLNQVDHMAWFGIQAFYNNYTVITNNISTFNAGAWDQSGITNDHSSFSTIRGNVVESNGKFGVYVERSWNVTVSENLANDNHGFGIGFYHGTLPTMGRGLILGNVCSFNGLGGIVLNSAVDNVISMNRCSDNSGDGVLLYNDPGQAGSTSNLVSNNWLGNIGNSPGVQMLGIREANDSNSNVLTSNVMVNNTVAETSILGP